MGPDLPPDLPYDAEVAAGRRSLVATWIEVLADASGLVHGGAALARAETSANLKALGASTGMIAAGAAMLGLAIVFLTVCGVVALAALIGLVWALLAVGGLCILAGLALVSLGRSRLAGQRLLPEKTMGRISADLHALAARGRPMPERGTEIVHETAG